jgi:hypothetical protein
MTGKMPEKTFFLMKNHHAVKADGILLSFWVFSSFFWMISLFLICKLNLDLENSFHTTRIG